MIERFSYCLNCKGIFQFIIENTQTFGINVHFNSLMIFSGKTNLTLWKTHHALWNACESHWNACESFWKACEFLLRKCNSFWNPLNPLNLLTLSPPYDLKNPCSWVF